MTDKNYYVELPGTGEKKTYTAEQYGRIKDWLNQNHPDAVVTESEAAPAPAQQAKPADDATYQVRLPQTGETKEYTAEQYGKIKDWLGKNHPDAEVSRKEAAKRRAALEAQQQDVPVQQPEGYQQQDFSGGLQRSMQQFGVDLSGQQGNGTMEAMDESLRRGNERRARIDAIQREKAAAEEKEASGAPKTYHNITFMDAAGQQQERFLTDLELARMKEADPDLQITDNGTYEDADGKVTEQIAKRREAFDRMFAHPDEDLDSMYYVTDGMTPTRKITAEEYLANKDKYAPTKDRTVEREMYYNGKPLEKYDVSVFENEANKEALVLFQEENADFVAEYERRLEEANAGGRSAAAAEQRQWLKDNAQKYRDIKDQEQQLVERMQSNPEYSRVSDAIREQASSLAKQASKRAFQLQTVMNMDAGDEASHHNFLENVKSLTGARTDQEAEIAARDLVQEKGLMSAASRMSNDALRAINAPSTKDNGFLAFLKGHGDTFTDADFWTRGLTEIATNYNLSGVLEKLQKKIHNLDLQTISDPARIDKYLTEPERQLLQSYVLLSTAQAQRAYDVNNMYQAGKTSAESLGFMAEFILTGGIGKAVAEKTTKAAFTKYLRHLVGEKAAGASIGARAFAAKTAESIATPIVKTAAMMGAMPGTYKTYWENRVTPDAETGFFPTRSEDFWKTALTTVRDQGLEVWSEQSLEPILGVLGIGVRGALKGTGKFTRKDLMSASLADIAGIAKNSDVIRILREAGFNGYLEEMGEEVVGAAVRQIWDKDSWSEFWDPDNVAQMAVAFAPMSLFGGGASMVNYEKTKQRYEQSLPWIRQQLAGQGLTPEQIEEKLSLEGRTMADVGKGISSILSDAVRGREDLTDEDYRNILDFASATAQKRIVDEIEYEQKVKQRDAMKHMITQQLGGKKFISTRRQDVGEVVVERDSDAEREQKIRQIKDSLVVGSALNVGGQQGRVSSVGADHVVVMFDSPVTVNGETGTSFELSLEEAGRALPQPIDASPRTDGVTQMDFDYVHTIRMKDGTVRYVIDDATARGAAGEDSDVMTIDREGNVRFMDRASIEDESNEDIDFSSKDTHRWSTTAYLDKMVEDYRAAQEQQRRDAIQAQKDGDVRGALYAGRSDLRIEYNGVMTDGIVLGTVGDRIAVQPVGEDGQPITNADGTPYYEVKTLQECGRALGMDVQVQTEDEAIRERAMQAVIDEADCFRANNRGPAILQHNGQDYTFVRVKPTFTDRDTALDVVVVDATGMTTVLTDVTMEEIRAMQPISEEKAAQQAEAAQQAAAAQQETEYARAVKAVTREDGSVDGSQLLQDNPGAFARWSDSSRGKEATDALINSNILKAQQELQAAQTAVDTETDPNRQEELIAERDRRAARLQTLVDLQMSRTPQDPAAAGALSQQDAANAVLSLMQRGLSIQEVASLADSEAVEAVKRQAAVVKPKISADIEGYKQQMQQYDAAIDAEQKKIDYWQSVKNAIDAAALQQKASNVQAFVDSIRGDMPAQAVTMDNVVEVMQADGCPAEAIARVSVEIERVLFAREHGVDLAVSGFHSNGKVYIFAESVNDEVDAEVTFRHERQHEFNAIDGSAVNAVLGTGISREDLALLVHNLCGNDQYANDDSRTLADELIAFGLEDAKETINVDRLRKAGIADEIINILENEYRQQRADGYNLQARRARALQLQSAQERSGHDVQDNAGGAGQVDGRQLGADEGSNSETRGRREEPAAEQPAEQVEPEPAEGEISDELKQELQDRDLVFDGDAGIVTDTAQAQLKQESGYQTPNERAEEDQALFSIRTLGPWSENYRQYPGSEERVIVVVNAWGERAAADELVSGVISQGNYEYRGKKKVNGSFAGPLRTNVEYVVTFDMDTTCPRTFQYLNYATKIERQIGRPLTQRESVQLIEMMRAYGQQIPCVYCYAENKRQALKQYFTDFMTARTGVLSAKNDKEALKVMYGRKADADKKSNNPEEVLTEAAEKVFRQWRTNPESIYNPSLKTLWKNFSYARNSVLSDLDLMLSEGRIKVEDKDSAILKALAKDLRVNNAKALKVLAEFVAEWHWDAIENRPHKDFQELDEDDFDAYEQDLSVWRDMTAYAKSASSAKSVLKYIPYTDELKYLSQEDRDYINGMGGVRMHSTNDFRLDYVLDYFQFIADMAANRMFGHTYTKSPEFVRIFGNTGYKINMSIAAYEDADGNIRMNEEEGFNWDVAKELREQFPNAGVMLMATSNNQIQMALDSDWIDMFIPFHNSGLLNEIWKDMRLWTNYQSVQNEAFYDADAMTEALEARGVEVPRKIKSKDLEDLFVKECGIKRIYVKSGKKKGDRVRPHFLPGPTMVEGEVVPGHNNDLQTYLDLCRQYGVRPRFYGTKVKDADGNTIDISEHPNYIKCIKETARIDTPQQAVRFNLDEPSEALGGRSPMEYAFEALKNQIWSEQQQMGGAIQTIYDSAEKDIMGIIPQFIDKIVGYKERTGKELPLDYLTPDARDWYLTQRRALEQAYQNVEEIPYHPNAYDEEGRVIPKRKEYVIPLNKIEKINAGQKQAGDQSVTEADLQPALNFRTVYHGSGAKFDKFSTDFMSTGEGNQAYGWGTYVTTNEETGRKYAEIAGTRSSEREYYESKIREYQEMMRTASDNVKRGLENQIKDLQARLDAMPATERSLYTVEIPDDNGENYLHWDQPITRSQSRKIIDGIKAQVGDRLIEEYGDEKSVDYELKSALGYGTYGSHVEGALDYFFGNETNYATGENPGAERNSKFLNSLGIVGMEIPIDRNGGRRYEGSNFVIYNTDDAVIANRVSFRISNNNRQTIEKWVSRWAEEENRYGAFDSDEEMRGFVQQAMQFVEDTFQDATEQLAWAKWFSNGAINYGEEDVPKVKQAVKVARNHKADPLRYGSPMEIINQWPEQIKDSAIDPDTVSTLHRAQEVPGTDIVIYDVDESEESRRNMREIINTHFGKKSSPWCLLHGDENGVLTPASRDYWNRYGAYPKQVAFKGGKLLAFCANNSTQVKWWDKQDRSHEGVPVIGKIPGDELGRSATLEYGPMTGEVTRMSDIHKGNKQNGEYTEWYQPSGQIIERSNWKNGVQHGVTEFYTTSGILSTRANFKEGKLDGLYEHFFNSDGAISGVETYRDGEMLTQKQYYHTGQLSREYESTYPGDGPVKSTRTTYSKDGVVTDRSIIDDSVYFIGSEGFMRNGTRTYVETSDGYMVYTRYTLGDIQYQIDARDMAGHRSTTYRATDEVLSGLMKQAIDKYQEAVDRNDLDDADDWRAIRGHLINVATNGRGATVVPQISEQKVMSLDEAYEKAKKDNVSFRIAPNGNPSNLTPEQYDMVRTPEFKAWFGDWENDPENASKLVDENGEPKVFYHGTGREFNIFRNSDTASELGAGYYFTDSRKLAEWYSNPENVDNANKIEAEAFDRFAQKGFEKTGEEYDESDLYSGDSDIVRDYNEAYDEATAALFGSPRVIPVFLNVRNPRLVLEDGNLEAPRGGHDGVVDASFAERHKELLKQAKVDYAMQVMTYDNTQIKSATGNNGQFDANNPDIRFRVANQNQEIFVSNAEQAVNGLNMPKATPEQWLKAIQGRGGLKAGEDKWLGLSEWLQSSDRKSITKEEVLQFINENSIRIEEVHYSENGRMTDEELSDFYYELPPKVEDFNDQINDEFRDLLDGGMEWREAYDTLAEKYGTSFEEAYDISEQTEGDDYLQWIYPDPLMVLAGYKTDSEVVSEDRAINSTRLTFTTGGLRNKREIALTVPTIKPWNKSDDVHFGDAGEGRAVAWIRFGETVIPNGELDNARSEFEAFENQMREKYGRVNVMDMTWEESRRWSELEQRETDAHTADGAKVLVIDEIQSKRHQEGRDKGYTTTGALEAAQQRLNEFIDKQKAKYGGDNYSWADNAPAEEVAEYDRLLNERNRLLKGIPDAPFEKNWHELAMKRMLRLAAEEGYDYVAWTTGEQQAERYSIGGLLDRAVVKIDDYDYEGKRWIDEREPRYIALHLNNANEGVVDLAVDKDGNVFSSNYGDYIGKSLSDIVGKEMSIKLMSTPIDGLDHSYSGDDLRIGGEGMKGFYDDILPRFMNKYGKKWGVKTQDIELPNVEEAGRVMHAVPVTDAMKQSIMEGQPMFRITAQQDAEYMQAVEAGDMEKAQRMVKAAAENAGYTAIGYHGTIGPVKRFGANRDGNIFFSKEREAADAYAQRNADEEGNMDANVIRAYLDLGKTAVVDAMENQFDEIGYKFTVSAPDGYEADFDNYPDALNEAVKHKNADIDTDITDTEGIGKIYRNKGYDSVIIENVYDLGNPDVYDGMQTDFILFNPRRIKSADPVTYDDAGNVIPLSQRFNPDSNDIRFRLAPNGKPSNLADEQYDAVRTPEFKSWFGDWENDPENASKVLDENGEPMVMYHGSRNGYGFTVFDTHNKLSDTKDNIGSHFGPKDTAAEFAGNDKMYAVFLNIRNPYNTWDFFADVWNNAYLEVIQELLIDAKKEETRKIAERIYDVYPQLRGKDLKKIVTYEDYADDEGLERTEVRISEKTGAAYQTRPDLKKNRDAMVAIIKDMMASEGYDGMVYENMYEGPHEMCYVALEPNQIKSATENNGNFSNDNPDIRFRIQNNYDGQWQGNFIYTGPKVEGETEKQILDYIMMSLNKYMPQYGMKGEDAIEEAIGYAYNEIGTGDAGTENWTDEIVDKFKPGMFTDVAETNRLEAAKKAKKARKQLIKEEAARKPVSPVTPEQDEEFRQAYEAGDEDKAMQMLKDTFKAMYPNTAVIDESGSPLVVYHGTPNLFNEFKGYMVSEDSEFGGGYYFTDSRKLAEEYTRPNGDNDWMVDSFIEDSPYLRSLAATQLGYAEAQRIAIREVFKDARVIPAFLNIVSPLKVDDMLALAEEFGEYEHVTDGLKANGYDGVIDNTFYARHKKDFKVELERGTTQYILNSIPSAAKNIKSAEPFTFDDKGELIPLSKRFDKSTNDIRFRTVEQRQSAYDQMNALRDELTQKYGTFNMGALSPEDQKRWSDAVDTWLDEAKDGRKAEVRFHVSYPSPVTDRQKETVAANLKTFTDPKQLQQAKDAYINAESTIRAAYESEYGAKLARKAELEVRMKDLNASKGRAKQLGQDDVFRQLNAEFQEVKSELNSLSLSFPGFGEYSNQGQRLKIARDNAIMASGVLDNEQWKEVAVIPAFIPEIAEALMELGWNGDNNMLWATEYGFVSHRAAHHRDLADNEVIYDMQQNLYAPDVVGFSKTNPSTLLFIRKSANDSWYTTAISVNRHKNDGSLEFITTYKDKNDPTSELERVIYEPQKGAATANQIPGGFKVNGTKVSINSESTKDYGKNVDFRFIGEKGARRLDTIVERTPAGKVKISVNGELTQALALATQMEKDGREARDIKVATGWERGADGKWRYEQPDIHFTRPEEVFWTLDEAKTLGSFVSDPTLFKAYPELKDLKVYVRSLKSDTLGAVDGDGDIVLNSKHMSKVGNRYTILTMDVYETLLHELQHKIQALEGFARGDNSSMSANDLKEVAGGEAAYAFAQAFGSNTEKALLAQSPARLVSMLKLHLDSFTGEKREWADTLIQALDGISPADYRRLVHDAKTAIKQGRTKAGRDYRRSAGEVEARNVESRRSMTDANRRNVLASETEDIAREEQIVRFRKVTDKAELDRLNSEPTIRMYCSMTVLNPEETDPTKIQLVPVKSAKVKGKMREPSMLGQWERSEEDKALAKQAKNGRLKFDLKDFENDAVAGVNYNPYFHLSDSMMNDQFTGAYDKPNTVVVEVEVPASELTSGYHADGAADSVGILPWHSGTVNAQLPEDQQRRVMLSRWRKPVRVVPDSEVAQFIARKLEGTDIAMPWNLVTPGVLAELDKLGVEIGDESVGLQKKIYRPRPMFRISGQAIASASVALSEVHGRIAEDGLSAVADESKLMMDIYREVPEGVRREMLERADIYSGRIAQGVAEYLSDAAAQQDPTEAQQLALSVAREALEREVSDVMPMNDARWMLYQNVHRDSQDLIDMARKTIVADRLGFSREWMDRKEAVAADIAFRTVNNAYNQSAADMYSTGLDWKAAVNEAHADMYTSVVKLVDAIATKTGRKMRDHENVLLALNQLSSKNFSEKDAYTRDFLNPMWDMIRAIATVMKGSSRQEAMDEIQRYVMLKHGLERNEAFAKRDALSFWRQWRDSMVNQVKEDDTKKQAHYDACKKIYDDAEAKYNAALAAPNAFTKKQIDELKAKYDQAKSSLDDARYILNHDEADVEADFQKHVRAIEKGTDAKYKELRLQDYSGLMAMYYDEPRLTRMQGESRESFRTRIRNARKPLYDVLADAEARAQSEVDNFENALDVDPIMVKEELKGLSKKLGITAGDNLAELLWDRINAATKETLRHQHESGMLSDASYDALVNMFKYYVPMRGFNEGTAEDMYTYMNSKGDSGFTAPVLRAKGRRSRAENPFGVIGAMAESAIQEDNKNLVKQKLYNFVSNRPNNGLAELSEAWYEDTGMTNPDGKRIYKKVYPHLTAGMSQAEMQKAWDDLAVAMEAKRSMGVKVFKGKVGLDLKKSIIFAEKDSEPEHFVRVKIFGEDYDIIINSNPRAAQAINGKLNSEVTDSEAKKFFMAWNRLQSALATSFNPNFVVTNFIRDVLYSQITALGDNGPKFWARYNKNLAKVLVNGRIFRLLADYNGGNLLSLGIKRLNPKLAADYEEYVMNGGPTGYTYLTNNKEYEKKMDKYLKAQMGPGAFRALSEFKQKFDDTMEAVEQIGRFAAYLTAKEQGMSIQQAVNAAKEITLNFNRKGSGKAIGLKEAAQFVTSDNKFVGAMQRFAVMLLTAPASAKLFTMFYNAQVQGLQKFGRLIKNAPAVMIPVMGGYFALGAINALIHGLWAGGDGDDDDKGYVDDYFNVPEYMRRTNIIIGVGGHDSHKYLRIPIPQELAPFYGAGDILITEMLRRTKVEPNGNPGAEIMSSLGDLLPFNAVEPFISKKNGGKGLGGGMADVIGRGIAAFSTPYSLLTNETFYGAPIYPVDKYESPEAEANKARWKEHYEKTGEAYVWIAKAINAATGGDDVRGGKINLYPEQIKFVTEDMLGGTGKFWSQVVNTTAKVIKGTTPVMDDIPFVSRIMTDTMEKNQDSHYRNLLNWYSRDVFPEMKREMDEYKRSYIAKHPEISDELDAIEAETDRLKEEYESMKGLRGKEYTERRRQINDRKDELKARDAELNDIKPEDYMPRKVLNSPEFKVWLQASEEYDIDASRFLPKEIRDLDKQIKKETDPEKIEILKQDRMLMVRDFVADLSVRYREADSK